MNLAHLEAHLQDPAPGFRCYNCGDSSEALAFIAKVRNHIAPPASAETLALADQLLGPAAKTIRPFYARHNGLVMYEDTSPTQWSGGEFKAAGVAFFPIEDWAARSDQMRQDLQDMGFPMEEMSDWLRGGIAFGEIPHSANVFVIDPSGDRPGRIYYASHDDFIEDPIAESFEKFLESILADPADFLYRHGCYTRYSDGKTDIQWIPKEYVADIRNAG